MLFRAPAIGMALGLALAFGHGAVADITYCADALAAQVRFSTTDVRKVNKLRRTVWSEDSTLTEQATARRRLLDWTTQRLGDLGFKTRVYSMDDDDNGGKMQVIQIVGAPASLGFGKVLNHVFQKFGARVMVDPTLLKSSMSTEAFFMEIGKSPIIMLDLMELKDMSLPSQPLLHEIRHLHFYQKRQENDPNASVGELESTTKRHKLTVKGDPAYNDYISLEEISTYYRDSNVIFGKFLRGESSAKEATAYIKAMRAIATGIVKHIDAMDPNPDLRNVHLDRTGKTITYPISFSGQKNVVATMTLMMPDLTATMTKQQAVTLFLSRMALRRADAEKAIDFAGTALAQIKK